MKKDTNQRLQENAARKPRRLRAQKSTFAVIFIIQKSKVRVDGTVPIVARITVNGEMVHFATRMYIHPDRWQPKDYRTAGKTKEEKQINEMLEELRVLIRRKYDEMLRHEEVITAGKLKNAITGLDQNATTLLQVCDRFIEDYTDLLKTEQCCRETYLRYKLTRNRLAEFMQARYRLPDMAVKELHPRFATDFDRWLRMNYRLTNNSTMKLMRQLKTMRLVEERSAGRLQAPFREGGQRLPDRRRAGSPREQGIHHEMARSHPRPLSVHLLYRLGLYRPQTFIRRYAPPMARRQPVDRYQTAEDRCTRACTPARRSHTIDREIRRYGQRRLTFPRPVESEGQLLPERDCKRVRHRQGFDIPHGPPHLRYDRDAGQRSADRNRIEDARTHEYSDNADLCAGHRHEDQQRHGGSRRQAERQGDDSPDNGCCRFINGILWNCKSYRTRFTRCAACGRCWTKTSRSCTASKPRLSTVLSNEISSASRSGSCFS